jgi:hypothetical protein
MQGEVASQIVQEFLQSTPPSSVTLCVSSIDPSINRDRYLEMKSCMGCPTAFGKQGSKKYYCHFCYGALCSDCSLLTLSHPETQKEERTCTPCYVRYVKERVFELSEEFVRAKLKQELEEKEREIEKRKQISQEIEAVRRRMEMERSVDGQRMDDLAEKRRELERKEKDNEANNRKMHEVLVELVDSQKVTHEEYKAINPHYVRKPVQRDESCMKCLIS